MNKRLGLNGFQLKWVAIITMCLDHVGAVLFPQYLVFRIIGRLAFPIFTFLLVEGFMHTSNENRYLLRLGLFALISEIPFDLAFQREIFSFSHQNVFFSLFLGLLLLVAQNRIQKNSIRILVSLFIMLAAYFGRVDYNFVGILFILGFYYFRDSRRNQCICLIILNLACFGINTIQAVACLSAILIWFYNGEKGKSMKYFFYLFYPLHLLVIYGIFWYIYL